MLSNALLIRLATDFLDDRPGLDQLSQDGVPTGRPLERDLYLIDQIFHQTAPTGFVISANKSWAVSESPQETRAVAGRHEIAGVHEAPLQGDDGMEAATAQVKWTVSSDECRVPSIKTVKNVRETLGSWRLLVQKFEIVFTSGPAREQLHRVAYWYRQASQEMIL